MLGSCLFFDVVLQPKHTRTFWMARVYSGSQTVNDPRSPPRLSLQLLILQTKITTYDLYYLCEGGSGNGHVSTTMANSATHHSTICVHSGSCASTLWNLCNKLPNTWYLIPPAHCFSNLKGIQITYENTWCSDTCIYLFLLKHLRESKSKRVSVNK